MSRYTLLAAPALLGTIAAGEGWREKEKSTTGAEVPCDGESALLGFK